MQKKVKGDGRMDRPTDTVTYRVAFTRLKMLSLGAVAVISVKKKLLQAITTPQATPFFCHLPENFNFWSFLTIFPHLCRLMGDPLIPLLLLLTKMLSLGAAAMKSTERKLLQAISTPFSRHLPEN